MKEKWKERRVKLSLQMTNSGLGSYIYISQVPGWEQYEARRQGKHSKQISSNVMLPSKGFDDGLDHAMQR